ncbi:MAG: fibronectin type III domain-containing protein, partial [Pirellulaceae bacterium]|nr:fibronectin type III domain-containing protein [Pirellulaceae bacterium]
MNLQTGEYRKVKYLSHGGTSPNRDRKVGYAGGGIYSTDFFGDDKKFVASAGSGGHIAWMSSPDWCLAGNAGKSGDSPFSCQLVQVFVNDGNWCRIAFGQTKNTTYGSYLFVNTSPDGTKAEYSSTMLGPRDMYWAVMNRPEPPRLLKATRANGKVLLEWERPETGKEYAGARIWRAEKSGGPYQLISGRKPVNGTTWSDPNPPASACYVATSVEPSTLESRRFSDEVRNTAANNEWPDKLRIYAEAETGKPAGSFAVNFHGTASNDRFIEHRRGDGEGILDLAVQCERATDYRLWIRARTTKGPASATANAGQQNLKIQLKPQAWSWHSFDGRLSLKAGSRSLRIQSIDPGFAVDKILLTDDFNMIPAGLGDTEAALPSRVKTLNAVPESPHEVRLSWQPDPSSDVHHFNIYRIREKGARPSQENLIGSPSSPAHLDWGLEPGSSFEYAVTAVDSFGRESEPVRASATTRALVRPPIIQVEAESGTVVGGEKKVVKDKDASGGAYLETPPDALKSEYRLSVSFTVEKEGNYIVWAALFPLKDTHIYLKFAVDGKPNA